MGLSVDILVHGGLFILLFLFAFFWGKEKIFAFTISLYIASFLYSYFPYNDQFRGSAEYSLAFKGIIFLVLASAPYLIFSRLGIYSSSTSTNRVLHSALLALGALILLIFISYHIIPLYSVYNFSSGIDNLFQPAEVRFWWLAAPLLLMFPAIRK